MPNEEHQVSGERLIYDRRLNDGRSLPDRRVAPSIMTASLLKRVSWQALLIGTLLALAIEVVFFVLGMAIGIYTPTGTGSLTARIGCWEIIMMAASLVPAGYVGARAAGIPSRRDSIMHGVMIWAITILAAPSLGGRVGVASAFAVPADLPSALWAFSALAGGLLAAMLSAWFGAPHIVISPRRPPTDPKII